MWQSCLGCEWRTTLLTQAKEPARIELVQRFLDTVKSMSDDFSELDRTMALIKISE